MGKSKNLLAQENGQYYVDMAAAKRNVENYKNLVTGVKTRDSDFIRTLVNSLDQLLGVLQAQESAFYS
jgi:hypothetical protein